ncbi:MAG: hypothetical protein N3G74_02020 [Candidatus Micrarchaeota archaeon]|nr:hypothetical protein [Candidatus Micrarchaeota archaeon]
MAKRLENKLNKKKGFVFTILTLVIIVFMIIELNVYFRTYELKLANEPSKLRLQVMQDFIKAYSPNYFNNTAYSFVYSALYKLNNDSINYPPSQSSLAELLWNISYTGKRTDSHAVQLIDQANTLSSYDSNLSALAKSMNMDIRVNYRNFNISQVNYWTVQYNFTMDVSIYDKTSSTNVKFSSPISLNISIIGFEDPWLARMGFRNRSVIPSDQANIAQIGPSLIMNGNRGRGWFYGEPVVVTSCPQSDFEFADSFIQNKTKIMVTDNVDVARQCGQLFGAAIIVGDAAAQTNNFIGLDIPLFINTSAKIRDIPAYPLLMISDNNTELTDNSTGHYHYLLNIENMRNSIECGRYIERRNFNYGYLRRLTNNVTGVFDEYGIETILSGTSQSIPAARSTYSFVDREYNASIPGNLYKGLPGCNSELLCNFTRDNAGTSIPYPIRLSSASAQYYLGIFNASMKR